MSEKYHIKPVPTPGRFRHVGKYGSVDWREDCARCSNCVKPRCVFDTYRKEAAYNRDPQTSIVPLNECRACFSCVQGCTKGILAISINPEYLAMGDEYWKPDIMATTWNQSDTGRVPVSGAGYRGRFHGFGFDSIWTDMSEIVRPTRDGIHGREYISTSVDIGPKPMRLSFSSDGKLSGDPANLIDLPLPLILDVPAWQVGGQEFARARLTTAAKLKTLAVARAIEVAGAPAAELPFLVPLVGSEGLGSVQTLLPQVRMVEFVDGAEVAALAAKAKAANPKLVVAVRLPLQGAAVERILQLSQAGVRVFHLCGDLHGCAVGVGSPRHIKDVMREVHGRLVKAGVRDEITLIVAGGIALPEHMAKAIICGADLVAVDTALLVSLGCRVCRGVQGADHQDHCPAAVPTLETGYAVQRMVNLMAAWHSQLLEVLGAMGIREVRRLRGEVGRAIFKEDVEREAFGDLLSR
jgi:hypothetical protein